MSNSEMLRKIKNWNEMKHVRSNINTVTKSKDGHLRMVLTREVENIDDLTKAICSTISNGFSCTRLSDTFAIEIRDADEETSDEEIISAIVDVASTDAIVKIMNERSDNQGTQTIIASIPTSIVNILITSRLRIGYVNCRVRLKSKIKKCFRYQGFGHTRSKCTQKDRNDLCWRNENEVHKTKECTNKPECFFCKYIS